MCYGLDKLISTLYNSIKLVANCNFRGEADRISIVKLGVTIDEAAEITGIGRNTMRKLVEWGKLPVLKVGRKTIIRTDTLEHFMTVNQGRNLRCQNDVRRVE